MELYLKNQRLITEKEWKNIITKIKKQTNKEIKDKNKIKKLLKEKLANAVKKRIPEEKFGILFSGGIDSSLIAFLCKKFNKNFNCYAVGFENSQDITFIKKMKNEFKNYNIKIKIINFSEAEEIIKGVTKIFVEPDVVKVGVGSVLYSACNLAKRDNVNVLFSGLGSEEIFAGYERHMVKDVNKECWRGLKNMWKRDLVRDYKISRRLKIRLLTPFLDKDLISVAMQIPEKYKISESNKKIILREVAQDLKLPKEICWRKKSAAQYGSGFDKAISKLAKKRDYKYKKDYLANFLATG